MPLLGPTAAARTGSVLACVGLVAALTGGLATAQPPAAPAAVAAAVPMNYTVNAQELAADDAVTGEVPTQRAADYATRLARKAVEAEGGTVLQSYPVIGVVVASSEDPGFDNRLRGTEHSNAVQSVGATRTSPTTVPDLRESPQDLLRRALIQPDPHEANQWGNAAIESLQANEVQPGSADVLVGVLDSGIDSGHPDLASAIDHDASVDCTDNGRSNTAESAWNPTSSTHGTHVAGTIAAQRNGVGVAGVAPGVRLASIKVVDDDGFIFPEYALCGFMWAGRNGVDVTNNSYYIDPWMFWCADDRNQGAVQESVRRAVTWTGKKGVVNVAAAGNSAMDLANKTTDSSSPNDSQPVQGRPINARCLDLPAELPGVLTVSATESDGDKSGFSNYGDGVIDVSAPGSGILSTTWPSGYGSLSGTSMASPHVAGVAALTVSEHPSWKPRQVRQHIQTTATDVPCPATGACTGTAAYNGFFGHGLVNALAAVS
jgi:hypothetical protein